MTEPLPQRVVPFYNDKIVAVQQNDGTIFVLFSHLCENLGLSRWTQSRRVQSHAVLSTGLITLPIETPGGPQEIQCLRLDLLPLWLAGVSARRADETVRERLVRYQTEAAQVLWREFRPQIIVEEAVEDRESALAIGQLEQIIEQSRAMQRMAEEQIALIRRMDAAARIVKTMQTDVAGIQVRLGVLEDRLHPASFITEEQASQIQSAVASIAMELTRRDGTKNHFQGIHGELHRRFKVRSYNLIRQEHYAAVLRFLDDWHVAVSAAAPELPGGAEEAKGERGDG